MHISYMQSAHEIRREHWIAWNWISCHMGTRNPVLRRAASAPAPELNCFNKVDMVVYACNMNTWLRQEDDHKDILNTELTESNLSYSLKTTNKKIFCSASESQGFPCVKSWGSATFKNTTQRWTINTMNEMTPGLPRWRTDRTGLQKKANSKDMPNWSTPGNYHRLGYFKWSEFKKSQTYKLLLEISKLNSYQQLPQNLQFQILQTLKSL